MRDAGTSCTAHVSPRTRIPLSGLRASFGPASMATVLPLAISRKKIRPFWTKNRRLLSFPSLFPPPAQTSQTPELGFLETTASKQFSETRKTPISASKKTVTGDFLSILLEFRARKPKTKRMHAVCRRSPAPKRDSSRARPREAQCARSRSVKPSPASPARRIPPHIKAVQCGMRLQYHR